MINFITFEHAESFSEVTGSLGMRYLSNILNALVVSTWKTVLRCYVIKAVLVRLDFQVFVEICF